MPRVIDLFCGCGGLSLGFEKAGFQLVRAFDNWDKAVNIYNKNFIDHKAELKDVHDLTVEYLTAFQPDVITGDRHVRTIHPQGKGMNQKDVRIYATLCRIGMRRKTEMVCHGKR